MKTEKQKNVIKATVWGLTASFLLIDLALLVMAITKQTLSTVSLGAVINWVIVSVSVGSLAFIIYYDKQIGKLK